MRTEPFGFTVYRSQYDKGEPAWEVFLPHQCGSWDIIEDDWPGPTTRVEVVAALERFISEATWALEVLRELPDDWRGEITKEEA